MNLEITDRGLEIIELRSYLESRNFARLVGQSSAVGSDVDDAAKRPGASYLWVGDHLHLNREEVAELARRLDNWCKTGSLRLPGEKLSQPDETSGRNGLR